MENPVQMDDLGGKKNWDCLYPVHTHIPLFTELFHRTEDGFISHTFAHDKVWKSCRTHFYHGFLKRHLKKVQIHLRSQEHQPSCNKLWRKDQWTNNNGGLSDSHSHNIHIDRSEITNLTWIMESWEDFPNLPKISFMMRSVNLGISGYIMGAYSLYWIDPMGNLPVPDKK